MMIHVECKGWFLFSAAVTFALEVEPELENTVAELGTKTMLAPVFPLPIHDLKRNVFVGGTGVEPQNGESWIVGAAGLQKRR